MLPHCCGLLHKQTQTDFAADSVLTLEEKGLAFTFSAVRAAYAAGGDCESDVRVDVRNLAAFVRDPVACVTCFLLPLSCTLHLKSQARPQACSNAQQGGLRAQVSPAQLQLCITAAACAIQ